MKVWELCTFSPFSTVYYSVQHSSEGCSLAPIGCSVAQMEVYWLALKVPKCEILMSWIFMIFLS
jgi:hypothetical protein